MTIPEEQALWTSLANTTYDKNIYIFGKGPGFHEFKFDQLKPDDITICVNETALHVPNPTYVITLNDHTWPGLLPAFQNTKVKGLISVKHVKAAIEAGIPQDRLIPFTPANQQDDVLGWSKEELIHCRYLYANTGSAVPAVHWAQFLGCSSINFVGFDGGVEYAEEFSEQTPGLYNDAVWAIILDLCDHFGIEAKLHTGE